MQYQLEILELWLVQFPDQYFIELFTGLSESKLEVSHDVHEIVNHHSSNQDADYFSIFNPLYEGVPLHQKLV